MDGSYVLHELDAGSELTLGPFEVRTALLPHPRPNLGFRIDAGGRSLVYTGDCGPSEELIALAEGTDCLLAEASYAETVPEEIVGALSSACRRRSRGRIGQGSAPGPDPPHATDR